MIGKYLVKLVTKFALKRNDAIRIADGYDQAVEIGVLYSLKEPKKMQRIQDFLQVLKRDGKKPVPLTFVPKVKKDEVHDYPHFTKKDLSTNGKWKNPLVKDFQEKPFDYLINLDWETNKFTRSILAVSKAKCRMGRFEEDNSKYFELMINHGDDNYDTYVDQVYHYLTNMRNG
jgi:hypothetical protein